LNVADTDLLTVESIIAGAAASVRLVDTREPRSGNDGAKDRIDG